MKFKQYLNEGSIKSIAMSLIKDILKFDFKMARVTLKKSLQSLIDFTQSDQFKANPNLEVKTLKIINSKMKTNFKSFNDLKKLHENELNEDLGNFWKMFKIESWPALSVFPTLSIWFEVDKLWSGVGFASLDHRKMIVYGLLWLFLLTGKHITGYNKWKKEHPEEFEKEGQPGIFIK